MDFLILAIIISAITAMNLDIKDNQPTSEKD